MYVEGLKTSDIFISFQRTSYEITVTYTEGLCSRDLVTRVIISKNRTLRAHLSDHSENTASLLEIQSQETRERRQTHKQQLFGVRAGAVKDTIHHMLLEQKESPWDNLWPLEGARG